MAKAGNFINGGKEREGMRIELHPSSSRGRTSMSWLESHHSFSFNTWQDLSRMGFGTLRVINEDFIAPRSGFGTHSHSDMEIVTIVLSGELTHEDSTGGKGVIRPGEVQRMTAGTGVTHSEMNAGTDPVHLLQIWVRPQQRGLPPSYEQGRFRIAHNKLTVLVDGTRERKDTLRLHQQARISLGILDAGKAIECLPEGRGCYVLLISGGIAVEGETLGSGDAAAITGTDVVRMAATEESRVLVIEVAAG